MAFLGLGSNLGDRMALLQRAVELLGRDVLTTVEDVSSVYETDPVGGPQQEPFLNLAVRVRTRRSPHRLLQLCHVVEDGLGRVRVERWGPRTIDIDVLLYDDRVIVTSALVVPHARLTERAFVVVPLMEVAPGGALPDGRSLASLVAALAPIEGVVAVGRQITADRAP